MNTGHDLNQYKLEHKFGGMSKDKSMRLFAGSTLFVFFVILGFFTSYKPINTLDIAVSRLLAAFRPGWLVGFMKIITWFGYLRGALFILLAVTVLLVLMKYWTEAVFLLISLTVLPFPEYFKNYFDRPRPTLPLIGFKPIAAAGFSFPSGHAAFSAAVYGIMLMIVLLLLKGKAKIVLSASLIIIISLVAFSRVYLGAHFTSDVIGGLLLGSAWGILMSFVYYGFKHKQSEPFD